VRFASLGGGASARSSAGSGSELLLAHSAYPTLSADAVFFGPDTYRFAALLAARVERAGHVADVGCGSGAGGLLLASRAASVQLLDGPLDLVIANPPYLADEQGRTYRDGGGGLGTQLSARIAAEALDRLEPGGRLLLYTATPGGRGRAPPLAAARAAAARLDLRLSRARPRRVRRRARAPRRMPASIASPWSRWTRSSADARLHQPCRRL
jgi:SAM-dependent methyltransferase